MDPDARAATIDNSPADSEVWEVDQSYLPLVVDTPRAAYHPAALLIARDCDDDTSEIPSMISATPGNTPSPSKR